MATYSEANDKIQKTFFDVWQPRVVIYESAEGSKPDDVTLTWARPTVQHFTGNQDSLIGGLVGDIGEPDRPNVRRYRRGGVFTAQIFVPIGKGLVEGYELSNLVSDAFEGTSTPSDVWFRNVRLREIGPDGEWFQTNVLADFEYTEIK